MGRLNYLETKINKGLKVLEGNKSSSNQRSEPDIIHGWSPNNIRRLIIGIDTVVIQYFVTGGRYKSKVEKIDFTQKLIEEDVNIATTTPNKYKGILSALVTGRVCSCIEEIIFCSKGYQTPLLNLDTNLSSIESANTPIDRRFKRLRHITVVDSDVKTVAEILFNTIKSSNKSLLEYIGNNNLKHHVLVEPHKEDWWKSKPLRPQYYSMDKEDGVLSKYLSEVEEKLLEEEKKIKLVESNYKREKKLIEDRISSICGGISLIFNLMEKGEKVFEVTPTLAKLEWASLVKRSNMCMGVFSELNNVRNDENRRDIIKESRTIDFDKIIKIINTDPKLSQYAQYIADFRALLFDGILKQVKDQEYKLESNKASIAESLDILEKLTSNILNTQCNIIYVSLIKYLTKAGIENVTFYHEKIMKGLGVMQYNLSIVAYCNKFVEDGKTKACLDKIGAKRVEDFKLIERYKEAEKILEALKHTN